MRTGSGEDCLHKAADSKAGGMQDETLKCKGEDLRSETHAAHASAHATHAPCWWALLLRSFNNCNFGGTQQ